MIFRPSPEVATFRRAMSGALMVPVAITPSVHQSRYLREVNISLARPLGASAVLVIRFTTGWSGTATTGTTSITAIPATALSVQVRIWCRGWCRGRSRGRCYNQDGFDHFRFLDTLFKCKLRPLLPPSSKEALLLEMLEFQYQAV